VPQLGGTSDSLATRFIPTRFTLEEFFGSASLRSHITQAQVLNPFYSGEAVRSIVKRGRLLQRSSGPAARGHFKDQLQKFAPAKIRMSANVRPC
jgi:hypothetical protein